MSLQHFDQGFICKTIVTLSYEVFPANIKLECKSLAGTNAPAHSLEICSVIRDGLDNGKQRVLLPLLGFEALTKINVFRRYLDRVKKPMQEQML
jgi:hypothetical protein